MAMTSTCLTDLPGVGPKLKEKLQKAGIDHPQELLWCLPRDYEDRTRLFRFNQLRPGQKALVCGEVYNVEVSFKPRRMLKVTLADNTGYLVLRFFYFYQNQIAAFKMAEKMCCFGEARLVGHHLEMAHPEYDILTHDQSPKTSQQLTPIYPTLEGISPAVLRRLIAHVLEHTPELNDLLPEHIVADHSLMPFKQALQIVHRPSSQDTPLLLNGEHPAQRRLVLEELIAHRLGILSVKAHRRGEPAPSFTWSKRLCPALLSSLPFALTEAQERVVHEISNDLQQSYPMRRLLQGDVGSGKTLVALMAALQAIEQGYQVALLVPTEILAEQHLQTAKDFLQPLNLNLQLLKSKQPKSQKQATLEAIRTGKANLIIGTHALFQEHVQFSKLGLIIFDEQHRFGVKQRKSLIDKGSLQGQHPHQLTMTATPIPRTLAMTFYADLEVSIIDELPPGRKPIKTVLISQERRDEVIARIRQACTGQKQVYWVCPLIENSETLSCQAAEETAELLKEALPEFKIGLVHGRLKPSEKQEVMQHFSQHQVDILVATTVIEVGVNVPNASIMIIENPERLGLAQLHQLRGRVGRGSEASFCLLLYQSPLSNTAQQRLNIMRKTQDGFLIAEEDLKIRGPGDYLGTRQTGDIDFLLADLNRDTYLLPQAQKLADRLYKSAPLLCQQLVERWLKRKVDFSSV